MYNLHGTVTLLPTKKESPRGLCLDPEWVTQSELWVHRACVCRHGLERFRAELLYKSCLQYEVKSCFHFSGFKEKGVAQ